LEVDSMNRPLLALVAVLSLVTFGSPASAAPTPAQEGAEARPAPSPQPRAHGQRAAVDPARVSVDDGDTVLIRWGDDNIETVRILGIDTPETRHLPHNLPYAQPFGEEASAFASGAFAGATQIELLRASTLDPYGRTLGYFFLNGRNYSVLVVAARLAYESVTHYGDNGFPEEAAAVLAAAKAAGPLAFEPPWEFRNRMRELSQWLKARGAYPQG
jgi:endonuclease YncB( thermonuclease family)